MRSLILTIAAAVALAAPVAAQQDPGKRIEAQVFAPELVMKHGAQIGLTADQRKQFTSALGVAQGDLVDLQWQLSEAAEAMAQALEPARVNDVDALAKLDRALDLERQVKRRQMALVIKIKNILTPEQQAKLKELRAKD
jgi:Spy/CpxP family protein refolding chaperone